MRDDFPIFASGVGAAAFAGHLALRSYFPLNQHIGAFLGVYCALCLLSLAAVLRLRRLEAAPSALSPRRRALLPYIVLGFAAACRLVFLWDPPILSTDIYRYIWDGRVQLAGISPYLHAPAAPALATLRDPLHAFINHPELSTIYPPAAQWLFRAVATAAPTIMGFKAAFILFDLLTIWTLMKLLALRGLSPAWALVYAWHPLPVIEFAGSGHLDAAMIFLLVWGLYLLERGRHSAGSAALAAAAMTKLAPLVMIPWLLVQRRRRSALVYFGVVAACAAPFAPAVWQAYRHGLPVLTGPRAFTSGWLANPSLFAILGLLGVPPTTRKLVLACALMALSIPWARGNRDNAAVYALGCLYALLLCSSVVQPWYVLWLLPLLCLYPLWSGLAWTWLVGSFYVVLDQRLSDLSWHYPAWLWLWVIQYGVVYGFLLYEVMGSRLRRR